MEVSEVDGAPYGCEVEQSEGEVVFACGFHGTGFSCADIITFELPFLQEKPKMAQQLW